MQCSFIFLLFSAVLAGWCLIPGAVFAQRPVEQNFHGWYVYNGAHRLSPHWELLTDWHYRRHNVITAWQQLLLRGGLQRDLTRGWAVGAGYAFVRTHSYGLLSSQYTFNENRMHQQVVYRFKTGSWSWQERVRWEERWLHTPKGLVYGNRIRTLTRANIPLRRDGRWHLALYDELFLGVWPNPGTSVFDQNRAVVLLGRRLSRNTRLEFGYMHQPQLRRSGAVLESNHTLMLVFNSTAPIRE